MEHPKEVTRIIYIVWSKKESPATAVQQSYFSDGCIIDRPVCEKIVRSILADPSKLRFKIIETAVYSLHSSGLFEN